MKKSNLKYIIFSTNCDCASGRKALHNPRFIIGPRCPYCNKILGPMQYTILGEIHTQNGKEDALKLYRYSKKD